MLVYDIVLLAPIFGLAFCTLTPFPWLREKQSLIYSLLAGAAEARMSALRVESWKVGKGGDIQGSCRNGMTFKSY